MMILVSDISLTVWRGSFSTTSLTHITSLSLIILALPLPESSSTLFLPCFKCACHLNTVDFFIASPAIFNKLNVSVGVCPRLTQNFIAARISTTIFVFAFPFKRLTITSVLMLFFGIDVRNFARNIKWCHSWCWRNISRFESELFEISSFLKA